MKRIFIIFILLHYNSFGMQPRFACALFSASLGCGLTAIIYNSPKAKLKRFTKQIEIMGETVVPKDEIDCKSFNRKLSDLANAEIDYSAKFQNIELLKQQIMKIQEKIKEAKAKNLEEESNQALAKAIKLEYNLLQAIKCIKSDKK